MIKACNIAEKTTWKKQKLCREETMWVVPKTITRKKKRKNPDFFFFKREDGQLKNKHQKHYVINQVTLKINNSP